MPYTQVSNLDYQQIKTALKDYLRSQTEFTDYDFEGSTLSTLLDLLAYNTYYTAFNTNLVVNELFLDSATLRDNVVSIAKQLGYKPKSVTSPVAYVNFDVTFTGTAPNTIILKQGTGFTTVFDDNLYQYVVLDDIEVGVVNGVAGFRNVPIYEGTLIKNTYNVNTSLKSQRFIIQNVGVDTTSIKVKVFPSISSTHYDYYSYSGNILNDNAQSKVYFLEEIEDERYEIFFGDGVIGRKLENGEYIEITYLSTNGADTNGAKTFTFAGVLLDVNGASYPVQVNVLNNLSTPASGGSEIESVSKIKFNAVRYFGTQDRAVTADDYAAIIRNIYPAVADIITFGGEDSDPPEYGKVKISIKPNNAATLSKSTKKSISDQLKPYMVGSVTPDIIDPSILYVELTSKIFYDRSRTVQRPAEIQNKVISALQNYIESSDTEKFNGKFRYSKFIGVIDDADRSINSNETSVVLRKDFYPGLNSVFYYEICFQNKFADVCDGPVMSSSGFTISEYPRYTVYLEDRKGAVILYRIDSITGEKIILNDSIGKINYNKGEIQLFNLTIIKGSFSDNRIEIRVKPFYNDIIAKREVYLDVDISRSKFTAYQE